MVSADYFFAIGAKLIQIACSMHFRPGDLFRISMGESNKTHCYNRANRTN